MKNIDRTVSFKKNTEVETLLELLGKHLSPIEEELTNSITTSSYSPIFIFGCARSGTTVLHQYLINNTLSIYPSNFISRFFYSPYIGGIYYKLFTQLDSKGELLGSFNTKIKGNYSSDLGKTEGILSPNEFWYFWRKHFPTNLNGTIDVNNIDENEASKFRNSIFALQELFKCPFITKGMIANNCIDYLSKLFPNAIFIYIKRDLYTNSKSLYQARINFYGVPNKWYSFYPKDPEHYQNLTPEEQVVHQVIDTNNEIENSLSKIISNRIIKTDYESFCENPKSLLNKISSIDSSIFFNDNPQPNNFISSCGGSNNTIKLIIEKLNY